MIKIDAIIDWDGSVLMEEILNLMTM